MKVISITMLMVCAAVGWALDINDNGSATGGEWNNAATWDVGVPGAADTALLNWLNAAPITVSAGNSEACTYLYASRYAVATAAGTTGGWLSIDGQLDISGGIFLGNWFEAYGYFGGGTTDFTMDIGDTGIVNLGGYGIYAINTVFDNDQNFNINGGSLSAAALTAAGTTYNFDLFGDGYLNIAGAIAGVDLVNIDFASTAATFETLKSNFDALNTAGNITSSVGTVVMLQDLGNSAVYGIPEPATMALLGLGAIAAFRRKR